MSECRSRRVVVVLLLVLVCASLMVWQPHAVAAKERKVIAKLWVAAGNEPWLRAQFDGFEKKTGIRVEWRYAPGTMLTKWEEILVEVAGGLPPDVTTARLDFVGHAASGLLAPLDPFLKSEGKGISNIVPVLLKPLQWKGQQYGLPVGASGVIMMYNWQLFDEAGVAYPPKVWDDPGWTFERFVSSLKKLTKQSAEGTIRQFGLAGPPWDSWITLPLSWGSDWVDLDARKFLGDHPKTLRALQDFQDLGWVHHVMPQSGETGGGRTGFLNGKVAMAGLGTWDLAPIAAAGVPMTMSPWFSVDNARPAGHIYPDGLVILRDAPNREEAWEFLKFICMDPQGNALRTSGVSVPGVSAVGVNWMREQSAAHPRMNPSIIVEQAANYPAFPYIMKVTTYSEIAKIMSPAVAAVINNRKTPTQAMSEVAGPVQALIDQSLH